MKRNNFLILAMMSMAMSSQIFAMEMNEQLCQRANQGNTKAVFNGKECLVENRVSGFRGKIPLGSRPNKEGCWSRPNR